MDQSNIYPVRSRESSSRTKQDAEHVRGFVRDSQRVFASCGIQTDIVIIGDGIAGMALAYVAGQNGLNSVILGKDMPGATNSATGFLSARPDYMLRDRELVRRTAYECNRWKRIFYPQIIKPELFLIPIGPELPKSVGKFEALLDFYDKETKTRLSQLPSGYFKVNKASLEIREPNLKKDHFNGALVLWESIVDPNILLKNLYEIALNANKVLISKISGYTVKNNCIQEVFAEYGNKETLRLYNDKRPLLVVNAAGPWIPDIWKLFGISLPMELRIGVQAQVLGQYLRSGIITFGPDKKYVVCLQKNGYVQVGPTNGTEDIEYLHSVFAKLIEAPVPEASFLKSGSRVKAFSADTQRPVIWSHRGNGIDNLYSLHPGKMVLALLAADELLAKAKEDGWIKKSIPTLGNTYSLKGESRRGSYWKIRWLAIKSFTALAVYYLKFLLKQKPR
ncbi:MAG: FAD-dependent oxidoreductase [Candidatus Yanofskybacteria bacterium]|nr:FAD-dependent oxidoreductase [Candidatus Yanofskybacteria bacterium]